LIESTNSINSGTILIANRAGRERILGALRWLPRGARQQIMSALREEADEPRAVSHRLRRLVVAFALSLATAAALWYSLASGWRL
jgi:hypothetical protein